jgi:hypothetical protein
MSAMPPMATSALYMSDSGSKADFHQLTRDVGFFVRLVRLGSQTYGAVPLLACHGPLDSLPLRLRAAVRLTKHAEQE